MMMILCAGAARCGTRRLLAAADAGAATSPYLALRALDGRLVGESYRVIAAGPFGDARIPADPGWKTHGLRDRTIRLVRAAIGLMLGGYLDLLRE